MESELTGSLRKKLLINHFNWGKWGDWQGERAQSSGGNCCCLHEGVTQSAVRWASSWRDILTYYLSPPQLAPLVVGPSLISAPGQGKYSCEIWFIQRAESLIITYNQTPTSNRNISLYIRHRDSLVWPDLIWTADNTEYDRMAQIKKL